MVNRTKFVARSTLSGQYSSWVAPTYRYSELNKSKPIPSNRQAQIFIENVWNIVATSTEYISSTSLEKYTNFNLT